MEFFYLVQVDKIMMVDAEKLWKAREKQLRKVLLNAAHARGSIEGLAGMDSVDLNLPEDNSTRNSNYNN